MSTGQPAGGPAGPGGPSSEEELRAAYEAEIKKIRVEQILLEQVVTLVNLGMRRTGQMAGTEDERDLGQVRLAIEALRALVPLIEQAAGPQAAPIRDALSRLQMDYVRLGGTPPGAGESGAPAAGSPPPQGGPPAAEPVPGGGTPQPGPDPAGGPGAPPTGPDPAGAPGAPPTGPDPAGPPGSEPAQPGEPGPAQRSGRLWVPGR